MAAVATTALTPLSPDGTDKRVQVKLTANAAVNDVLTAAKIGLREIRHVYKDVTGLVTIPATAEKGTVNATGLSNGDVLIVTGA